MTNDDHDRGLHVDVATMLTRRRALSLLLGAGAAATLAACGGTSSSNATAPSSSSSSSSSASSSAAAAAIPDETAGPYPGDGSNGPNVLSSREIVRRDIRSSFGGYSGTAEGVPLTVRLRVVEAGSGNPLAGAAVYVWHCDRDAQYSLYTVSDQNYLRGVQEAAADGTVTFTSIFPAAYAGRWPHIHFEIYPSLAEATRAGTPVKTTQLALPENVCRAVYATSGYEASVANLARTSLSDDMVFRDGWQTQLASVDGSVSDGYVATLDVPV